MKPSLLLWILKLLELSLFWLLLFCKRLSLLLYILKISLTLLLLLLSFTFEMMLAATLPAARTKLRNVKALTRVTVEYILYILLGNHFYGHLVIKKIYLVSTFNCLCESCVWSTCSQHEEQNCYKIYFGDILTNSLIWLAGLHFSFSAGS